MWSSAAGALPAQQGCVADLSAGLAAWSSSPKTLKQGWEKGWGLAHAVLRCELTPQQVAVVVVLWMGCIQSTATSCWHAEVGGGCLNQRGGRNQAVLSYH